MTGRIEADYRIETAYPLAEAAAAMAGEQSSGTFGAVPGETPELKARAAAAVEALDDLGPLEAPALPGAAVRCGHRLYQGRRASGGRAGLSVRGPGAGGTGGEGPTRRPDRAQGDGRVQPDRRDRRDAPAAQPRRDFGRDLRDGEPELGRTDRAARVRRHASSRFTSIATAGARCRGIPGLGFDYVAWAKLWRLAGADHMHVNGLRNKFCEPDASVIASARSCLAPMFASKPCVAMPVFSSGQSVAQVADTFAALGSVDLIYAAGGGITGHPGGPTEGVAALREAWAAAMAGVPAAEAARGADAALRVRRSRLPVRPFADPTELPAARRRPRVRALSRSPRLPARAARPCGRLARAVRRIERDGAAGDPDQ